MAAATPTTAAAAVDDAAVDAATDAVATAAVAVAVNNVRGVNITEEDLVGCHGVDTLEVLAAIRSTPEEALYPLPYLVEEAADLLTSQVDSEEQGDASCGFKGNFVLEAWVEVVQVLVLLVSEVAEEGPFL